MSMEQKENMPFADAYKRLDKMRKELLPHGREIMEEHRFEVFAAIEEMYEILYAACYQGLAGLEKEREKIKDGGTDLDKILLKGIDEILLIDGKNIQHMFIFYEECERILWKDFIRYIYIRGIMMLTAGLNPRRAVRILLSLLPEEDSNVLEKNLKKRGVEIL